MVVPFIQMGCKFSYLTDDKKQKKPLQNVAEAKCMGRSLPLLLVLLHNRLII
jgi:hypothetical protein